MKHTCAQDERRGIVRQDKYPAAVFLPHAAEEILVMQICDVCKEEKEETFTVPGTSAAICDACLRAGRIGELLGPERDAAPAQPAGPAD